MSWLLSIFIMAIALTGCQERAAAPSAAIDPVPAQTSEQLSALVKPQFDAWLDCTFAAASKYFSANESADTIARAAMTACNKQERDYENALIVHNRTRLVPAEGVAFVRNTAREKLTQIIVERRQDIKLEKAYWDEWVNCVLDAAGNLAGQDLSVREAVTRSYRICGMQEDADRRQLAILISDPAAVMERRKNHASAVLAKFVEDIRAGGADRPKRPDITI